MVRLKQRYLLLNILYPDEKASASASSAIPAYLKFHAPTPQHIDGRKFLNLLRGQIAYLFGDHGAGVSASSLKIIYFSQATSTAIIRVPRSYYRLAWAALAFITELPQPKDNAQTLGVKCVIRVVRVSGTIKKAEQALITRSRQEIVRAKLAGGGNTAALLDKLTASVVRKPIAPMLDDGEILDDEEEAQMTDSG